MNLHFSRLLLIATIAFLGCKKVDSIKNCEEHSISACTTDPSQPNIRIQNLSEYTLCNVELGPDESSIFRYGILDPNEITCYRAVPKAYLTSYIHLMVGDSELMQQPFDFLPEDSVLDPGNFTLQIDVTELKLYGGISANYVRD